MPTPSEQTAADLVEATAGFDKIFSNDLVGARELFEARDSPFHALGLGVCAFLEAALGMESNLMAEATRLLTLAEAGARKQAKSSKSLKHTGRYPPGTEYELVTACATILLGLTNALSESYMGYLQCLYAINSAHGKFAKLYKIVFPHGIDAYSPSQFPTPASSISSLAPSPSASPSSNNSQLSLPNYENTNNSSLSVNSAKKQGHAATTPSTPTAKGFLGRWGLSRSSTPVAASAPASGAATPTGNGNALEGLEEGPVEQLIVSGTAFGYGVFNLVLSLLPAKVKSVVGFFGFNHDRKLALRCLSVSAAKKDVTAVFSGLTLMSYYGVVLLMSGYQANEKWIMEQYEIIVDKLERRYPTGTLWILNRAKILRMGYDALGAIKVLRDGLSPERPHTFVQADALLVFELAWTLLAQREYGEAAPMFLKMTELNSWSHGTYYFIAAGCQWSLGQYDEAQKLLDAITGLLDKKKIGGKDLPTEVLIKKKLAFYKAKQVRLTGSEKGYVEAITISPAEELGIFWNSHARISKPIAEAHIREWMVLEPPVEISTPYSDPAFLSASPPTPESFSTASEPSSSSEPEPSSPTTPTATTPTLTATTPTLISAEPSTITATSSSATSTRTTSSAPAPSPSHQTAKLDTPDELALRSLLLGIAHRTAGAYAPARQFLLDAHKRQGQIGTSTWIGGVAMFEMAVLELKEAEVESGERVLDPAGWVAENALGQPDIVETAEPDSISVSSRSSEASGLGLGLTTGVKEARAKRVREASVASGVTESEEGKKVWRRRIEEAGKRLDAAMGLAGSEIDLSTRLDSRIVMLRDEIRAKKEALGI